MDADERAALDRERDAARQLSDFQRESEERLYQELERITEKGTDLAGLLGQPSEFIPSEEQHYSAAKTKAEAEFARVAARGK